ncbi:MAG TPA: hypothetical protein VFE04_09745 [Puia sp.]|jgi:hypothetical protein|nr:hypothetical protein [Puia sp.]
MHPNLLRAGALALSLSFIAILSWEIHLRHSVKQLAYDDNEALWADKRARVYQPGDKATVFIGSSRIKYDLDIPTWRTLTGKDAIQLANVGSSPRAVLRDLANDPDFKGNLVIDVTEGLFFSEFAHYDATTNKKIAYFHHRTPTQRFSFEVNHVLESQLFFLDQDNFSINAMMDNLPIPPRPGVFPGIYFPIGFTLADYDRQSIMTPEFVADTNQQNAVKGVWAHGMSQPHIPPSAGKIDSIFNSVKMDVDKIKARGGQVLFIRTPSDGMYRVTEAKYYPKAEYWDRLLALTGCKGIYYADYPATANLHCVEWSHLKPTDGILYTKAFIQEMQEKDWPSKNSSVSQ